jgi:hypothetical protein
VVLAEYTVNVTNTESYGADDVMLGFIEPPRGGVDGAPLQSLFNFERVYAEVGRRVTVTLAANALDFTVVWLDGRREALAEQYTVEFGVAGGAPVENLMTTMGFAVAETVVAP